MTTYFEGIEAIKLGWLFFTNINQCLGFKFLFCSNKLIINNLDLSFENRRCDLNTMFYFAVQYNQQLYFKHKDIQFATVFCFLLNDKKLLRTVCLCRKMPFIE